MANIPNLVYLAPTNKQEYLAMLDWSIEQQEYPVAIRAPRNGVYYADYEVDKDYGQLNTYKKYTKDLTRYNIDNKVFHDTDILSVFLSCFMV